MKLKNLTCAVVATFSFAVSANAATFCVGNAGALVAALNIADNNGDDDIILLQQGSYVGNFFYTANAGEVGDLTIAGGYDPSCTTSSGNPADTVLDGNDAGRAIVVSGRDNSNLLVESLTVTGGLGTTQGAGLDIDRWLTATVSGNHIVGNETAAGQDGSAGLEIDRTQNIILSENLFTENLGGNGGGASLSDMSSARVERNVFIGNTATDGGGGGLDLTSSGAVVLANNLFAGNQASGDGGAVSLRVEEETGIGSLQATNNTFVSNSATEDGGALDLNMTGDAVSINLDNNLFWANTAMLAADLSVDNDDDGNGIAASLSMEHNNFNQAFFAGFWSRIGVSIAPSNFNAVDPLFVSATDFTLQSGSPMIDAGRSDAPDVGVEDVTGGVRVQGAAVDIGAYEVGADSDGDGVADAVDNCTQQANSSQLDTDGDGYGNLCDADLNNDGIVNFLDLGLLRLVFFSSDANADFNGDGTVNFSDLGIMRALFLLPPGPSGIAP